MSREDDFKTRMTGDATLMAILTGGVHTKGTTGREGITRDTVPTAFDANGILKPCALVRQRGLVPDGAVVEFDTPLASAGQVVEIYVYEDSGYTNIDAALARLFTILYGYRFTKTFPLELVNTIDRERDEGALRGASLARQDWMVRSIQGQAS